MQILNIVSGQISNSRLYSLVVWVHNFTGKPDVASITIANKSNNYNYNGFATYRPRTIKINIGKKLLSMRYYREISNGKKVLIDPCGVEETLICALAHEMYHLKLGGEFHKKVHQIEYEALQEWRKTHKSNKVKRFVLAVATFFLVRMEY